MGAKENSRQKKATEVLRKTEGKGMKRKAGEAAELIEGESFEKTEEKAAKKNRKQEQLERGASVGLKAKKEKKGYGLVVGLKEENGC